VDDSRNPSKDGQQDVDEEVGSAYREVRNKRRIEEKTERLTRKGKGGEGRRGRRKWTKTSAGL
jgi:hypothetical protein